MWQVVNCKNGISVLRSSPGHRRDPEDRVVHGSSHPVRAWAWTPDKKLSGEVEADETFIGGKARNMHARRRARQITGTGGKDKTAVMGILERGKDGKHEQGPHCCGSEPQEEARFSPKSASTLKPDPHSTPMR